MSESVRPELSQNPAPATVGGEVGTGCGVSPCHGLISGLISFEYRNTLRTEARTETVIVAENERGELFVAKPLFTELSRTGAHGEDVYSISYLSRLSIVGVMRIDVSNSGRHHCKLIINANLSPEKKARTLMFLQDIHRQTTGRDCGAVYCYEEETDMLGRLLKLGKDFSE